MLSLPQISDVSSWLIPLVVIGAVWAVVTGYQAYGTWRFPDWRPRRVGGIFVVLLVVTAAAALAGRAGRSSGDFPFDTDDVEYVRIERFAEFQSLGTLHLAGGPEVTRGLKLLEQSGDRVDGKSRRPARGSGVYCRVTIKLKSEAEPSRYVDAYPAGPAGGPCMEPRFTDSNVDLGVYRSEAFVGWVEEVMGKKGVLIR